MFGNKYIDLTLTIHNEMQGVHIKQASSKAIDGWNATDLHLYSHSGTHMDAPWHFEVNNQTIDKFSVDRFVVDTWLVDITPEVPGQLIQIADLSQMMDRINPGDGILLKTDWSLKIGTDLYRNALPRVSEELAHWLGSKKVGLLGVEPPSVADVNNLEEVTRIHEILLGNDIIIVEGLTNLNAVTKPRIKLIALPLKVLQGDGAPARVIAIE